MRLLTVLAFSLFLLINTSVTRVVLRGSLLLFLSLSLSWKIVTPVQSAGVQVISAEMEKKFKRGGGEKIPETGAAGM